MSLAPRIPLVAPVASLAVLAQPQPDFNQALRPLVLSLSNSFVQTATTPGSLDVNQVHTLVSTDIDNTLRVTGKPWSDAALSANNRVLNAQANTAVMGNTARGLRSTQSKAHELAGVGFEFLATNKGEQLFVNYGHQPADAWIPSLNPKEADPCWRRELFATTGWDKPQVVTAMANQLSRRGFKAIDPKIMEKPDYKGFQLFQKNLLGFLPLQIMWFNDETVFNLFRPKSGVDAFGKPLPVKKQLNWLTQLYGRYLAWSLQRDVKKLGMQTDKHFEVIGKEGQREAFIGIIPKGIGKDSVVAHVVQRHLPVVERVITAGDSVKTDLPMLDRQIYGENATGPVENHPVVSGYDKPEFRETLADNPDVIGTTQEGQLAKALQAHLSEPLSIGQALF